MNMRTMLALLMVLVALAACGGNDQPQEPNQPSPQPQGTADTTNATPQPTSVPALTVSTNDPASWVAGLAEPLAGVYQLPLIEDANGRLAYTQDTRLFLVGFDKQRAQQVAEMVNPYSLNLSPTGQHLAYLTTLAYQDPPNVIQVMDVTTLEVTTLLAVNTPYARVLGWSPDGAWIAVVAPEQLTVVDITTQTVLELQVPSNNAPRLAPYPLAAWLTDNRLLYTQAATPEQLALMVYDPATQTSTTLEMTLNTATPIYWGALAPQLAEAGLTLVTTPDLASNGAYIQQPPAMWSLTPAACDTWSTIKDGTAQYQVNDMAYLSHLSALPDDQGLLFLAWRYPQCSAGSQMQLWLLWQQANGSLRLISDTILPESTRDLGLLITQQSQRYTLTPDGRYVIYVAGSAWSKHASLEMTDLHTGQHAILMQVAAPSPVNLFTNVVWIPTDG